MSTVTARPAAGAGRARGTVAGRVGNLDVLRALAALAVLAGHAYFLSGRVLPVKAQRVTDVPLITLASGVWLFFALSGYVISRPFIDALVTARPLPTAARYLRRRAGRIFPLYWATVTIFVLIAGHPGVAVWQFPAHYLLLNNLLPGQQAALYSVAWTLTLEVLFYLLVPVLAGLARARWGRPSPALLARAILAGWALSIAFTAVADLQGDGIGGLWLRGSLPAMWQMFCPGLMLALAPHLAPGRVRAALTAPEPRRPAWWLAVGGCLGAGALLAAIAPLRFGIDVYELLVDAARPLFALGYGLIVAAAIVARPWEHRGLVKLGAASYGIYLLHPLIATALVKLGLVPLARDSVLSFAVHVLVLLILTVPVALASWRWLERPSIRWARGAARRAGADK